MRLFLYHDVYSITAQFLKDLGHDVVTTGESGHAQTDDSNTSYSYWQNADSRSVLIYNVA
jgi:hypothetical protein